MADIPDYLLERSRERRQFLTGQAGDAPGEADATAAEATAADAAAAGSVPATGGTAAGAPAGASAGGQSAPILAPQPAPAPPPPPPPPTPPSVVAALGRKRIPYWAMPVLLFLPIWAFLYVGTLESPTRGETGILGEGAEVYSSTAACASCHGSDGAGTNSGPQINGGELLLTFPESPDGLGLAQQIEWIVKGTNGTGVGRPYGAASRGVDSAEGHVAGWFGEMPGFGGDLTAREIIAVTLYERAVHNDSATARTIAALVEELSASGDVVLPDSFASDITAEEIQALLAPVFAGDEGDAMEAAG